MSLALITGSAGLIGSETCRHFRARGFDLVGIDNDLRAWFFGPEASNNLGGGRHANCSMLEAIHLCEEISHRKLNWTYVEDNRIGDHIWYISDVRRFQSHYPAWNYRHGLREMLTEIHAACTT